jgi:hypothetical protein
MSLNNSVKEKKQKNKSEDFQVMTKLTNVNLPKKRVKSSDDFSEPYKRPEKSKLYGVFLSNIPKTTSHKTLKKLYPSINCFIPVLNKTHLNIVYFLFDSKQKRSTEDFSKIAKNHLIKRLNFSTNKYACSLPLDTLASVCKNLKKLTDRIPSNTGELTNLNHEKILKRSQKNCEKILAENYFEIHNCFSDLHQERNKKKNIEDSNESTSWIIIFCICWFVIFKLKKSNLAQCGFFFNLFNRKKMLKTYFGIIKTSALVLRSYAIDVFLQIVFLDKAFLKQSEVLFSTSTVLSQNYSQKMETFLPDSFNLFKIILLTKRIRTKLGTNKNTHGKIVAEFLSKIFLVPLPLSISGITLFSRYVLIRSSEGEDQNYYKNNLALLGFLFMTAIHELGHFSQRFLLKTDIEWFGHMSPPRSKEKGEAGTDLIESIFKYEPLFITIKGSEFLFKLCSWDLNDEEFCNQFIKANQKIKKGPIKQYDKIMLKQTRYDFMQLGGCKYSNRNN